MRFILAVVVLDTNRKMQTSSWIVSSMKTGFACKFRGRLQKLKTRFSLINNNSAAINRLILIWLFTHPLQLLLDTRAYSLLPCLSILNNKARSTCLCISSVDWWSFEVDDVFLSLWPFTTILKCIQLSENVFINQTWLITCMNEMLTRGMNWLRNE